MNNIYGQPFNGRQEDINTRRRRNSDPQRVSPEYSGGQDDCGCHHHEHHEDCCRHEHENREEGCRQVPGTVFRINIPAGAEINILNIVELASPTGICLILRLPFLSGECGHD